MNDQIAMPRQKSSVPAVEKALDVIELLADAPEGMTMNEIVDGLGRTMGEVYRIVVYLTERGYLAQDRATNRYDLTLRLFERSHRHDPTARLIRVALPHLEGIAARAAQSCHLGVLNRENVLVLASVPSPRPAGYAVRTGALFPVEQTSSGHVILAFAPADVQERHVARLDPPARATLIERLDRIRAQGFEDVDSTMVAGVRNLCVPVFDAHGVVAAVTCGFIAQTDLKTTPEETLRMLREAAGELSGALGANSAQTHGRS